MGVKVSSATQQAFVFLLFILFCSLPVCLFSLALFPSLHLPSVMHSLILYFPPLYPRSLILLLSLCPSTSAPLLSLSLPRRHTYTDNTAATCCFGNILQQASVLHCSPFNTIAISLMTSGWKEALSLNASYALYNNQANSTFSSNRCFKIQPVSYIEKAHYCHKHFLQTQCVFFFLTSADFSLSSAYHNHSNMHCLLPFPLTDVCSFGPPAYGHTTPDSPCLAFSPEAWQN